MIRAGGSSNDRPAVAYQPLVVVLAAMVVGVVVDRLVAVHLVAWWTAAVVAWCGWGATFRLRRQRVAGWLLLIAVTAAAGGWHHCCWRLFSAEEIGRSARSNSQPICLEAVVLGGPTRIPAPPPDPMRTIPQGDRSELTLRATRVRHHDRWQRAAGRAEMSIEGHLLGVKAGDRVRVFAHLQRPAAAVNPGQFDRALHLRGERQLFTLRGGTPDAVQRVRRGSPLHWRRILQAVRGRCRQQLERHLAPERAELAAAVLLGAREQLDIEQTEAFFHTGTIHLLAISGLHVGILAFGLMSLVRASLLPRRGGLLAVMAITILYAVLTDARPSVIRATILVVAGCGAMLIHRRPVSFNSLAAAAVVVLLLNPAELFRPGVQLSFLAVGTLVWFGPWLLRDTADDPLERLIDESRWWPSRTVRLLGRYLWRLTLAGALIWLVALPLVAWRFHLVSPVALALNPLLWLPMGIALFAGFATLTVGWLLPPLAALAGRMCDGSLQLLDAAVHFAAALPGSHLWVPGPSLWWLVGFYTLLIGLAAAGRRRPPRRWCAAMLAGWILVGLASSTAARSHLPGRQPERLECTFLSVGHGTAVLLHLPDGRCMLYDAGCLGSPYTASRTIAGYLWSRGITHLDAVVITHADADHFNALPELLDRFSVGVVYVSPVMFETPSPSLAHLQRTIDDHGVPLREMFAGDRLRGAAATIDVLHPPRRGVLGSDNANSIVLRIDLAGRRILLPGDLESPGLDDVLAELPTPCQVAMAPHHGSARSNPSGFAQWCTPQQVIISSGYRQDTSEVAAAFRVAGAEVFSTAVDGAVSVVIDDRGVVVSSFNDRGW